LQTSLELTQDRMQVAAALFCHRNVLGFSALKLTMHSKRKLRNPQKRKLN